MMSIVCPPKEHQVERQGFSASRAFSLVEVVLAMGVATFLLLGIVGLLPVGLSTFQTAMEKTVEGQIVQRLSGQMVLTSYSALTNDFQGKTFYFNQEGSPVEKETEARYKVVTALTNSVYPGWTNARSRDSSDPATSISKSLQVVRMDVVRVPGLTETNRFNIHVPNSGN